MNWYPIKSSECISPPPIGPGCESWPFLSLLITITTHMIIRKFSPNDLEAVIALFCDSVHAVASRYYDPVQIETWANHQTINRADWLKNLSANITYVAEDEKKIIGFGDMTCDGYIDHLFVHKNYQGKGASLGIFKKFEEEARKLGLDEMTTEASIMAMPLAKRVGFEVLEKQVKVFKGVEFINYRMRKKL